MSQSLSSCVIKLHQEHHALEDYPVSYTHLTLPTSDLV